MTDIHYEPTLDGIRALAISVVILAHAYPLLGIGGWVGVDIFFALSGYLITRILMRDIAKTGEINLMRFYTRRFLRLMPPLWTLLLVVLVPIMLAHQWKPMLQGWTMAAAYLMNFNRAFGWWPQSFFAHTWSLAEEEQFYLLWPFLLLLIRGRHAFRYVCVFIAAAFLWRLYLISAGASVERIYSGLDTHADPLMFGCGLALLSVPESLNKFIVRFWYVWPAALLAGCLAFSGATKPDLLWGIPFVGFFTCCMIVAAKHPMLGAALSWRPLVFVGQISYALYLWHYPLLMLAGMRWHLNGFTVLIPVALSFAIATVSYFTVEAYFRRLKVHVARDKFTDRMLTHQLAG